MVEFITRNADPGRSSRMTAVRLLLINPPMTDVSGPFPAICYLAGFLETIGVRAEMADASLGVFDRLFCREGVERIRDAVREREVRPGAGRTATDAFLAEFPAYHQAIDSAVACLRGTDQGAAVRVLRPGFLPPPPNPPAQWATWAFLRSRHTDATPRANAPLDFAFGAHGATDEARYRASLLVQAVAAVIQESIDTSFGLESYGERLVQDAGTFAPFATRLAHTPNLLDQVIDEVADALRARHNPDVIGLSVPFPGTVYGALRVARRMKHHQPSMPVVAGGGWINTVLRRLTDPAIFDLVDFITLDDGERPLQCVLEHLSGTRDRAQLLRTYAREQDRVVYLNGAVERDVPFAQVGTPSYSGLPIHAYPRYEPDAISRSSLWRTRWNKLTLAHGCYWKKCAFCDTRLDYIGRYEPAAIDVTIDRIRRLRDQTGESGFHFVDEAMPPALVRRLAERLIDEQMDISWWGNVRFDRALADMAPLLAASGCMALTGGIETASDRLLALMEKGVSLRQVAEVTHALSTAGLTVHAYLIYGFPTQTAQETVDGLDYVRQLFEAGCLHSAYWHRFALTAWSPVADAPHRFGIHIAPDQTQPFANYVLNYTEDIPVHHSQFGAGLRAALKRYMIGADFDRPAHTWFDATMPPVTLPQDFVASIIHASPTRPPRPPQPPASRPPD